MKTIKIPCLAVKDMLPLYQSSGASGADLRANIKEEIILRPGEREIVPTGLRVQIPPGFEAQIRSRSGLAVSHAVTVLNAPGTIDSDYRGEVKVILINHGKRSFTVKKGDRIAQIIFQSVGRAEFIPQAQIEETDRQDNGFGSTGL